MSSIRVSRTALGFVLFALAVIALLLFSSVRIAGARAAQPPQQERTWPATISMPSCA